MIHKHEELTGQVIEIFYNVYSELGCGFLENVYARAMVIELERAGLNVEAEKAIPVYFRGQEVGEYFADIVVEGKVILELKAAKILGPEHTAQILNYLKATEIEVGLLLNFGPQPKLKRYTYDNHRKGHLRWTHP